MTPETYRDLQSGAWNEIDPRQCPCRGSGWILSDFDTYHRCQAHGHGVPHPEEEEPSFNWKAHKLTMYRKAYRAFQVRSGLTREAFQAEVVDCVGSTEPDMGDWLDAAEEVSYHAVNEAAYLRGTADGFSSTFEANMAYEAEMEHLERRSY